MNNQLKQLQLELNKIGIETTYGDSIMEFSNIPFLNSKAFQIMYEETEGKPKPKFSIYYEFNDEHRISNQFSIENVVNFIKNKIK